MANYNFHFPTLLIKEIWSWVDQMMSSGFTWKLRPYLAGMGLEWGVWNEEFDSSNSYLKSDVWFINPSTFSFLSPIPLPLSLNPSSTCVPTVAAVVHLHVVVVSILQSLPHCHSRRHPLPNLLTFNGFSLFFCVSSSFLYLSWVVGEGRTHSGVRWVRVGDSGVRVDWSWVGNMATR